MGTIAVIRAPPRRRPWRRRSGRLALAVGAVAAGLAGAVVVSGPAGAATPSGPPPVTILTSGANNANGDIFVTPTGDTATYANGPEIIDNHGKVVWFHAVPQGLTASDFRSQKYEGRPVLTWWQGTGLGGLASGTDYIYNDRYQPIAT